MVLPKDILEANADLMAAAKSASGRMQLLVDSLLDVARLEAGQDQFKFTETRIDPIVERAVGRVSPTLQISDIAVSISVGDNVPSLVIDEEKIDRVLTNLIDNAIKYTPSGGKITVQAKRENAHIQISVNDTGPGIPAQERKRIFERFAQVPGDQPRHRGFGLGLTFCQLAVEGHGGRIWVEPGDNDIGSKFIFTLPIS